MPRTRFPPLFFPRLWLALAVAGTLAAGVISLMPNPPHGFGPLEGDKDMHAVVYTVVSLVWLQVTRAKYWPLTFGLLLALGTALEIAQILAPTRIFHDVDLIANVLGVVVGGLLCLTPLGRSLALLDQGLARLTGHAE